MADADRGGDMALSNIGKAKSMYYKGGGGGVPDLIDDDDHEYLSMNKCAKLLPWEALEYWSRLTPGKTCIIYTDNAMHKWTDIIDLAKDNKKTNEKGDPIPKLREPSIIEDTNWHHVTFNQMYVTVNEYIEAFYAAGVPEMDEDGKEFRVIMSAMPHNKFELLAMKLALQATCCVVLIADVDMCGGVKKWMDLMATLSPDAILCDRKMWHVLQFVTEVKKENLIWFNAGKISKEVKRNVKGYIKKKKTIRASVAFTKPVRALSSSNLPALLKEGDDDDDDPPFLEKTAQILMTSGSITRPPVPVKITYRMLRWQAMRYTDLIQQQFGISRAEQLEQEEAGEEQVIRLVSLHFFENFPIYDCMLGGCSILHPMSSIKPGHTVSPLAMNHIIKKHSVNILSASTSVWEIYVHAYTQQGELNDIKVAIGGGAEILPFVVRHIASLLSLKKEKNLIDSKSSDLVDDDRIDRERRSLTIFYGPTQGLPLMMADALQTLINDTATIAAKEHGEHFYRRCYYGNGIDLGYKLLDVTYTLDTDILKSNGICHQLPKPPASASCQEIYDYIVREDGDENDVVTLGELCIRSEAITPLKAFEKNAAQSLFRTDYICSINPRTDHIRLYGRMGQVVNIGNKKFGKIPPGVIEAIIMEQNYHISKSNEVSGEKSVIYQRCAFIDCNNRPLIVIQLYRYDDDHIMQNMNNVSTKVLILKQLGDTLSDNFWSNVLMDETNSRRLCFVIFPKKMLWPVDLRHSSKTDRSFLNTWAQEQMRSTPHKIHQVT